MSFAKTPQARDSTNLSCFSRRNKVKRASKVWTPSGWRPRRWRYWEQSWPHTPALSNFFGVVRPWVVFDGKAMKCRSITCRFQSGIFDWTLSHTFFPMFFCPIWGLATFLWLDNGDTMLPTMGQRKQDPKGCLKHFQNFILMVFFTSIISTTEAPVFFNHSSSSNRTHLQPSY